MTDKKPTVLIVEDSDDCSETLELALLSLKDVRIAIVRSAEEALQHFAVERVAAMVTDLHLPQMDGLHLLSTIRGRRRGRRDSGSGDQRRQRSEDTGASAGGGGAGVLHETIFPGCRP